MGYSYIFPLFIHIRADIFHQYIEWGASFNSQIYAFQCCIYYTCKIVRRTYNSSPRPFRIYRYLPKNILHDMATEWVVPTIPKMLYSREEKKKTKGKKKEKSLNPIKIKW